MFLPNFGRTFSRLNSADKWKKTAACPLRDLEEKRTEPSRPFSPPFLHPTTRVRTTCFLTRIWCCYQGKNEFSPRKKSFEENGLFSGLLFDDARKRQEKGKVFDEIVYISNKTLPRGDAAMDLLTTLVFLRWGLKGVCLSERRKIFLDF